MKLHCINHKANKPITDLLKKACHSRSVEYIDVSLKEFDFSAPNPVDPGDALYRVSTGQDATRAAIAIERTMVTNKTATFYQSFRRALTGASAGSHILLQKENLPIPKTINSASNNRQLLRKYVKHLGGFPIIIKVMGGSHGVGVVKIDSFDALFSTLDVLPTQTSNILLREFIDSPTHARLIVLEDKVIDSIEYHATPDDFRTNVGENPIVKPKKFDDQVEKIAIQSVSALGIEFAGVDILFDQSKNPYIAEVNFPCNFARAQNITGVDTAGLMIDHLISKGNALRS